MTEKMSTEDTKQKMAWRTKQEEMDATALRKNPDILKDETKFKKQANLVSNLVDSRSNLKNAMERGKVPKEQFEVELTNIPKNM